jgi:hypothetical protein
VNNLAEVGVRALQTYGSVEEAEVAMLPMPQVDCPVTHYFGPGIAIREVFLPAGTLAVGHKQKFAQLNIMLRGKVVMLQDDGTLRTVSAPLIYTGQPGRKIGYALEDTVWQNVYATDLTDADAVEAAFIEKSDAWQEHQLADLAERQFGRAADRQDFQCLLIEYGIPEDVVRTQSENTDDQISVINGHTRIHDSAIEGKGLFVTAPVKAGEVIMPARIAGKRTQAGRYVNHSLTPNAKMVLRENGDIDLVAVCDLSGCKGGSVGEELTVDYRQALSLSGVNSLSEELSCQE